MKSDRLIELQEEVRGFTETLSTVVSRSRVVREITVQDSIVQLRKECLGVVRVLDTAIGAALREERVLAKPPGDAQST